jgi:hypothetical protein
MDVEDGFRSWIAFDVLVLTSVQSVMSNSFGMLSKDKVVPVSK